MLLASLLVALLAPAAAVFRGRPGLYTRLFDISPLCPHISFAQPAASTPAEDSILLLQVALAQCRQCYYYCPDLPDLQAGEVSVRLGQVTRPRAKQETEAMSERSRGRCNHRFR